MSLFRSVASSPAQPGARAHCASASLVLAAATALPGCSLLSTLELVNLAGQVAHTGSKYLTPARSSNTVHFGAAVPREACIEHNPLVPVADMLPALQAELSDRGVHSRVLPAESEVPCATWIRYAAVIEWDVPPLEQHYRPYLSQASLSMLGADRRLLSQSEYRFEGALAFSKWTSTRKKLSPVVHSLLTGFES
jgi:hypothetical protein